MKIAALPQVEFDSFPTDEKTKICIFTKLPYPIPDLSRVLKNGRQLFLYCTESTALTIGRLAKRLPIDLFRLLPTGTCWNKIDCDDVAGLDTPFRVACLPTGSVSDSVMLMIFSLNDPTKILLYTGTFQNCREVLISNFFIKYKKFIDDIFIDNTLANSKHVDVVQNSVACNDIKKIIDTYPKYKIHLQMEMFDKLDLLVELAQRLRVNVKLNLLQQIFFYKTKYKHLFQYDARIPKAADLNKEFQYKNRPEICVVPYETADIEGYKWNFHNKKIINIRLIASEHQIDVTSNAVESGLVYITYAGHAGTSTLHSLFHAVQPKRIHPIIHNGPIDDPMLKIPASILSEDCAIIYDSQLSKKNNLDVTLSDIRPAPKKRSFLDITVLSNDIVSKSSESNQNQTPQSTGIKSDESSNGSEPIPMIEISDDESVTVEEMSKSKNKKRSSPAADNQGKSKYFKSSDANCNEIQPEKTPANKEITAIIDVDIESDDVSSLSSASGLTLVFPTN